MNDKGTTTPQATEWAGDTDWERIVLGDNGLSGTVRLVAYALAFALVFGTLFYFTR